MIIGKYLNEITNPPPKCCLITTGTRFQFLVRNNNKLKLYGEKFLLTPYFVEEKEEFFKNPFVDVIYQTLLDFYKLEI